MNGEDFLQVILVANSLPALNDVTAVELPQIVAEGAKVYQNTVTVPGCVCLSAHS